MTAMPVFLNRFKPSDASKKEKQPKRDRSASKLVSLSSLAPQIMAMSLATSLVVGSALAVIHTAFDYRRLFNQHQLLAKQNDQVRIEWGQLLLEQSAWGANNRVEVLAEQKLQMQSPEPSQVRLVRDE